MLARTLHPHRKIAQTATASVGDAARGDDRHSTFGNCALRPPAAETVERGCDQFDLHRLLQPRGAPGRTKGAAPRGTPEGRASGRFRISHSSPHRSARRVELFRFSDVICVSPAIYSPVSVLVTMPNKKFRMLFTARAALAEGLFARTRSRSHKNTSAKYASDQWSVALWNRWLLPKDPAMLQTAANAANIASEVLPLSPVPPHCRTLHVGSRRAACSAISALDNECPGMDDLGPVPAERARLQYRDDIVLHLLLTGCSPTSMSDFSML